MLLANADAEKGARWMEQVEKGPDLRVDGLEESLLSGRYSPYPGHIVEGRLQCRASCPEVSQLESRPLSIPDNTYPVR